MSQTEVASGNYLDSQTVPSQEAETAQVLNFAGAGDSYFAYLTVPIHNDAVGEVYRTNQCYIIG